VFAEHRVGSLDDGISFEPMFESGNTLSLGAVAVAPDNPNVIYAGTGEGKAINARPLMESLRSVP
jgi:hypothetical protein